MTSVIKVDIPEKSYDITIAPGSLDQLGEQMASLKLGKKVLLVSNPMIFKYYGERAIASLKPWSTTLAPWVAISTTPSCSRCASWSGSCFAPGASGSAAPLPALTTVVRGSSFASAPTPWSRPWPPGAAPSSWVMS